MIILHWIYRAIFAALPIVIIVGPIAGRAYMQETPSQSHLIRKLGDELERSAIKRIEPVVPSMLKGMRLRDRVIVAVTVDEQGNVASARAVKGYSLLKDAAVEAALGWKFKPAKAGEIAIKMMGTITFKFKTEFFNTSAEEIAHYAQKVSTNPDSPQAHYNLADAYFWNNRSQQALEEYKRVIDLEPLCTVARFGLAESYFRLDRYDEAIESYNHVILLKPDYVEAYLGLGWAYERAGRLDEAIKYFKQATEIRADLDMARVAYINISSTYKRMDRPDDAIKAYQKLISVEREMLNLYPEAIVMLEVFAGIVASMYVKSERKEEAIEAYKQVIEIAPHSNQAFTAYLRMASLYEELGRADEAKRVYEKVLDITLRAVKASKSRDAQRGAYYGLGLIYEQMGRDKEAIEAYKKAVKLEPDWTNPHLGLARVYLKLGDRESAYKEYQIVKRLDEEEAKDFEMLLDIKRKRP